MDGRSKCGSGGRPVRLHPSSRLISSDRLLTTHATRSLLAGRGKLGSGHLVRALLLHGSMLAAHYVSNLPLLYSSKSRSRSVAINNDARGRFLGKNVAVAVRPFGF